MRRTSLVIPASSAPTLITFHMLTVESLSPNRIQEEGASYAQPDAARLLHVGVYQAHQVLCQFDLPDLLALTYDPQAVVSGNVPDVAQVYAGASLTRRPVFRIKAAIV